MSAIKQEPMPQPNEKPPIWTLVLEDLPYVLPLAWIGEGDFRTPR